MIEAGEGPPVVLCHGFPELAFSWRHQIPALAEAGYRVLAPDMRGYGGSSAPAAIEDYDVVALCGDMCGLLDAARRAERDLRRPRLGRVRGLVDGLRSTPSGSRAVAGLSVPFVPRAPAAPIPIMRANLGEDFYIVWFQEPGVADAALAQRRAPHAHDLAAVDRAVGRGGRRRAETARVALRGGAAGLRGRVRAHRASPAGSTGTATSTATGS